MNFDGIVEYFKERIKSLYSSFPSELNIIDCDIKSNSFLNFFKIFGNNKPLRALRINNCIFTEDSLQKIFQIILFNEKFHKLEEFVFENGYCDIGSFTCTYEYKNGTLYFYWGNAVWASFKCTINGNKIVVDNNGEYITYYKQ